MPVLIYELCPPLWRFNRALFNTVWSYTPQHLSRINSTPFSFSPNDTVTLSVSLNDDMLDVYVFRFYWVSWGWYLLWGIKTSQNSGHLMHSLKIWELIGLLILVFICQILTICQPLSIWGTRFLNFVCKQNKSQVILICKNSVKIVWKFFGNNIYYSFLIEQISWNVYHFLGCLHRKIN